MNSLDDFVDFVAKSACLWDSAQLHARDEIAAYYQTQAQTQAQPKAASMPNNDPLPHRTNGDVIMAGVSSCFLAVATIQRFEKDPHPAARASVAASRQVLAAWGLEIATLTPKEAQAADFRASEPDPDPDPAPTEEVLHWPPPEPALPAIYTQNYYIVRSEVSDYLSVAKREQPMPVGSLGEIQLVDHQLGHGDRLSFLGVARWSSERECWLMRMHSTVGIGFNLWVYSKALKPGDEIPKVIDAAAQARSTDP